MKDELNLGRDSESAALREVQRRTVARACAAMCARALLARIAATPGGAQPERESGGE